jgi:hypothetical protein
MGRLCKKAGVTADEMREDPEHGLLPSPSAVRKLAAIASDQAKAQEVRQSAPRSRPSRAVSKAA